MPARPGAGLSMKKSGSGSCLPCRVSEGVSARQTDGRRELRRCSCSGSGGGGGVVVVDCSCKDWQTGMREGGAATSSGSSSSKRSRRAVLYSSRDQMKGDRIRKVVYTYAC